MRHSFLPKFLLLMLLCCGPTLSSQLLGESKDEVSEVIEIPDDSLGRRNPRGTVSGFLQAVADQNYERASRYLNLRKGYRREKDRKQIVKILQQLLDRDGNIMPYSWISNKPSGRLDDDLAPELDLVGTVANGEESINLFVENTQSSDAPSVWQFSSATVAAIAAIRVEDAPLVEKIMPEIIKEKRLAGVQIGHWIAMLILIVFAYAFAWSIVWAIQHLLLLFWRKTKREKVREIVMAMGLPFRLYIAVWVFVVLSQETGISIIIRQRLSGITVIIGLLAFLILLWRLTDFIGNYSKERMSQRGRVSALSVMLFLKRAAKIAIVIFGCIAVLSTIGIDVTTGLAALGIGGLALALGAQKTIENLVGSVTLIADQPIRVGDFCKVGEISGTVESIGMRSTKLRTGERSIVTIPNGDFSSSKIENFAPRDRYLFDPIFELRLESTPDQLRFLLVELRSLLYAHPKINPDPARIRFSGLSKSGYKLETYAYINAPNFDEFLEIQEDLLLRMMEIIDQSGTKIAFESRTLYFTSDKGLSQEKSDAAQEKVRSWTDDNQLQIPKFDEAKINELKGTIDYPGKGSASKPPQNPDPLI